MGFFASHGDRTYSPAELLKEFALLRCSSYRARFWGLRDLVASAIV